MTKAARTSGARPGADRIRQSFVAVSAMVREGQQHRR